MSTYDSSLGHGLYSACVRGDKYLVLKLANQDNVNYVHPFDGDTPLHLACEQGWLGIVTLFIEKYGCDPNVRTRSQNQSVLHYACQYGHIDIVTLLIETYGCDPNVRDGKHKSVLHYACQYGHIDIVGYLIDKQHLNPLLRDNDDQLEPLDCALNNNKTAIAVYLCQYCISSDEMGNCKRRKRKMETETESGNGKRKRKVEKGNGRLSNTYTAEAITARIRIGASSSSKLGVHHWVGVKPGLWTGLTN